MKRLKKLCVGFASFVILVSSNTVFALEDLKLTSPLTEEFINWQSLSTEEKENILIPRVSTVNISDNKGLITTSNNNSLRSQILTRSLQIVNPKMALNTVNGYVSSNFNLKNQIPIEVKHQKNTNECWAFSVTSSLETNLLLTQNVNKKFSIRHMDYSSVRTFSDGINPDGLNREAKHGGLAQFAMAYLTNGKGAVLDSYMPFEDNTDKIPLAELNKPVDVIVTDYIAFPAIYKQYEDNGEVTYTNGGVGNNLKVYTESEITSYRNAIKNHIYTYGGISAVTAGNEVSYYSNSSFPSQSVAYFCNNSSKVRDHSITIVGWDDNYSRDNFTGAAKPHGDGAYICLNSYGTSNFDNGYIYISYEDSLIETYLYGIVSTSSVDYDNLYQYNILGENTSIGMTGVSKGYIAEVFSRDASRAEVLNYVGINIPASMSLKIYVNESGDNPSLSNCKLVASTGVLEPGYHRIPIQATNLSGSKFAIVIEEDTGRDRFDFSVEIAINDSIYSTITGNPGNNLYSINGYGWKNLADENVPGFDMKTCDLTIKAFTMNGTATTEPTVTSTVYDIKDKDIYKIEHDTTIEKFKDNITVNLEMVGIYDLSNNKVENDTDIVKTGMVMKFSNGVQYTLIVSGDLNLDGRISLIDLSKIVGHYGDESRYGLTGVALKAADMNVDGRISLIDISKLLNLLGNL